MYIKAIGGKKLISLYSVLSFVHYICKEGFKFEGNAFKKLVQSTFDLFVLSYPEKP
jgi:hypothetical protein